MPRKKKNKRNNKSTYMQDNYLNVHARLHLLLPPPSSVYLFQRYQCYIYIYISLLSPLPPPPPQQHILTLTLTLTLTLSRSLTNS